MADDAMKEAITKVPAVTFGFWIIKILATTLGETGGDSVSMSWLGETTPTAGEAGINGYLIGTGLFGVLLIALAWLHIRTRRFNAWLYWATIIASTTAGTTLADFATRSLGIGYPGGSMLLLGCVMGSLLVWYRMLGSVAVDSIVGPREEIFYWITITFSQTLGTASGDWIADSSLGYSGAAMVFGGALAIITALYFWSSISRLVLFWAAFILTRPLGATVGDFLDKPSAKGGLELSRSLATSVLAIAIVLLILMIPQRAGRRSAS